MQFEKVNSCSVSVSLYVYLLAGFLPTLYSVPWCEESQLMVQERLQLRGTTQSLALLGAESEKLK